MKQKIEIFGASLHQGKLDNGQEYDFCKIFVIAPLDITSNKVGFNTVEIRALSSVYADLKFATFPTVQEVEMGLVAVGKGDSKTTITKIYAEVKKSA